MEPKGRKTASEKQRFSILDWIVFSGTDPHANTPEGSVIFQYPRLDRFLWNRAALVLVEAAFFLSVSSTGSFSLEPFPPRLPN